MGRPYVHMLHAHPLIKFSADILLRFNISCETKFPFSHLISVAQSLFVCMEKNNASNVFKEPDSCVFLTNHIECDFQLAASLSNQALKPMIVLVFHDMFVFASVATGFSTTRTHVRTFWLKCRFIPLSHWMVKPWRCTSKAMRMNGWIKKIKLTW